MAGVSLATWAAVAGASVAAASAVNSADQQRSAAHTAADQAKANAETAARNRAEDLAKLKPIAPIAGSQGAKVPDAMRQSGQPMALPPTMLTGAGGVDPGSLNLGKNTLLGS